jgi:hypothetical protein
MNLKRGNAPGQQPRIHGFLRGQTRSRVIRIALCAASISLLTVLIHSFIAPWPANVHAGGQGSSAIPPNGPGLNIPDPDDFGFQPWDLPDPPDPWTVHSLADPESPDGWIMPPSLPEVAQTGSPSGGRSLCFSGGLIVH